MVAFQSNPKQVLASDNQHVEISSLVEKGVAFFFHSMEESLSLEQQDWIKQELRSFHQAHQDREMGQEMHFPKSIIESLYQCGREGLKRNNLPGLIDLFKLLTYLVPDTYDVWIGLGLAYQKEGLNSAAVGAFEKAKHIRVDLFHPHLFQAESYLYLKEFSFCQKESMEAKKLMGGEESQFLRYADYLISQCHEGGSK